MSIPNLDPPKGARGKNLLVALVDSQRRWIEYCEANGVSYTGENGPAIARADLDALRKLETRLRG